MVREEEGAAGKGSINLWGRSGAEDGENSGHVL